MKECRKRKTSTLIGSTNETVVILNDEKVSALIDTGSSVSTLSEQYYDKHLKHLPIEPVTDIINIECANGLNLPYSGYVVLPLKIDESDVTIDAFFLIVPTTSYHQQTPILIGTNILKILLEETKEKYGNRFLQTANLTIPWYLSFRCIALREKELLHNQNRLAYIKSAEKKKIVIPANTEVIIQGAIHDAIPYHPVCAILQATPASKISTVVDISPVLIDYHEGFKDTIPVLVSNISTKTVTINPREVMCEVQPVKLQDLPTADDSATYDDIFSQVNIPDNELSSTELEKVKALLMDYKDILSTGDGDIGHNQSVQHRIELNNEIPFKQRYRKIPPSMIDEVRDHLQQLLKGNIIRKSHSPFSSNVVLAKKRNGQLRLCIDYRQLNARTIKDNYALPRIDDILENLAGNKFFSVLDMKAGYYQVEIAEEHKERTAFTVGSLGFYEYNRMPFGLTNAPATYQRLMEECLGDLHLNICYIFLDDLIIFSRTFKEHLQRMEKVFQRLRESGLKLTPKKCSLLMKRVKYVGHVISEDGIEPDEEKIDKVMQWPQPKSKEDVRRFLGFVGYYRKFVKNFAKIARPLTDLLPSTRKKSKGRQKIGTSSTENPFVWNKEQKEAFTNLKTQLSSPPILAYPDYSIPFEVHTDASGRGLGAILYQDQEGHKRVISYASRGLSKAERNYPAHKMEFLALKWAITEKFKDYLYGHKFSVLTDNNPLTYVLTTAQLDATGHRWVAALAAFDFDIHYRPGKRNADADALSRHPTITDNVCKVPQDSVQAVCSAHIITFPLIESLPVSASLIEHPEVSIPDLTSIDIKRAQCQDPNLLFWINVVEEGRKPRKEEIHKSYFNTVMLQNYHRLLLKDGILYREIKYEDEVKHQLIVPNNIVEDVLYFSHNLLGHQGRDRTISLVQDRFFWPGLSKDVEYYISTCDRCLRRKTPTNVRAPLFNIKTYEPLELVCMDFLSIERSKGGYEYILVITDHFTKYAVAIPTRNMTAKTTAQAFYNNFVIPYGIPYKIHSDQGANFESSLIKELCLLLNIQKTRTTPYHPMGNGICERFNRTLINMLGTLQPNQKQDWKTYIGPIVHAYNSTKHDTTGFSPYQLIFGREPRLPIDLVFGTKQPVMNKKPLHKYIEDLKQKLKNSFELAQKNTGKSQDAQKRNYDLKVRSTFIQPGDKVLVKIVAHDGRHKIADKWEQDVYDVISRPNPDIPVFVVRKEDNTGRTRTLHRNLLMPYKTSNQNESPPPPKPKPRKRMIFIEAEDERRVKPVPVQRRTTLDESLSTKESEDHIDDVVEDSDDEVITYTNVRPAGSVSRSTNNTEEEEEGNVPVQDSDPNTPNEKDILEPENSDSSTVSELNKCVIDNSMSNDTTTENEHQSVDTSGDSNDAQDTPRQQPRRSTRERRQPEWIRSGDYVCKTMNVDWMSRADYLKSLINKDNFMDDPAVKKTFLELVTWKPD